MLLVGISTVQQVRQGVEMAVIAALKKKRVAKQDDKNRKNDKKSFHTPARFGWGMVAMELHPKHAKVWY